MKLQTKITFSKQQHKTISYDSKVVLLGSCFSENIGEKFLYSKIQSEINPFGILFQPLAIENLISRAINKDYYSKADLHFNNEKWCCLDAHSKLNDIEPDVVIDSLNSALDSTLTNLKSATHIIITLGTAWVYRHTSTDSVVANCHKIPQKRFLKELLSVDDISESLQATISLVRIINPKVNFIFTVSPVRHLKDGFVENTQSKSHLLAAVHQVVEPRAQISYFPSYEIVMDELRDYRFYNEDMIHPNHLAINYIWEKFKTVWFSEVTIKTLEEVISIQKRLLHKPFNIKSNAHQKFLANLQSDINDLSNKLPHISF